MGRGVKLHVLKAKWNDDNLILKVPQALESHSASWQLEHLSHKFISDDFRMTRDEITRYVSMLYSHAIPLLVRLCKLVL